MARTKAHTFKADFVGRIENMSLSPSAHNSLTPLFEAINNSIQAIEDKFGKDGLAQGRIEIDVVRGDAEDSKPRGFIIRDNGVGLNEDNLKSFLTADTRYKASRGGRGVGRFLWLKVFQNVHVDSVYEGPDGRKSLSFDFQLAPEDQIRNLSQGESTDDTGTVVKLETFLPGFASECPTKASTIKSHIIGHFVAYFVNMHVPKIFYRDRAPPEDLFDVFSKSLARDKDYPFSVGEGEARYDFVLHSFLLPKEFSDDEKGNNALFYGAHNRSVQRIDIDNALGMKLIEGKYVYCGFIEGHLLNSIVNQERTLLAWPKELFASVHSEAIEKTKVFLAAEIGEIRAKQINIIERLKNEHPRFLSIAEDPDKLAKSLALSTQSPEEIFLEMSRIALRRYQQKKRQFQDAKFHKLADFEEKAKEFTTELKAESISSLAEYVYKRKLILDVFEDRLKYANKESEKYQFEEAVHELICPLRETSDTLDYENHNLWIVDDNLAFYSYFASDKTLKSMTGGADPSSKEPDLTFFDLGLGFHRAQSSDPITIIEFKRPGRNDYSVKDNPITQVRDYVDRLRKAGTVRDQEGAEVRQVDSTTPFMCFIIADISSSLQEVMRQFGPFHRKAGHGSYYKWDEVFSVFIEISSYTEILRDAKARHAAFFEKLGISG